MALRRRRARGGRHLAAPGERGARRLARRGRRGGPDRRRRAAGTALAALSGRRDAARGRGVPAGTARARLGHGAGLGAGAGLPLLRAAQARPALPQGPRAARPRHVRGRRRGVPLHELRGRAGRRHSCGQTLVPETAGGPRRPSRCRPSRARSIPFPFRPPSSGRRWAPFRRRWPRGRSPSSGTSRCPSRRWCGASRRLPAWRCGSRSARDASRAGRRSWTIRRRCAWPGRDRSPVSSTGWPRRAATCGPGRHLCRRPSGRRHACRRPSGPRHAFQITALWCSSGTGTSRSADRRTAAEPAFLPVPVAARPKRAAAGLSIRTSTGRCAACWRAGRRAPAGRWSGRRAKTTRWARRRCSRAASWRPRTSLLSGPATRRTLDVRAYAANRHLVVDDADGAGW